MVENKNTTDNIWSKTLEIIKAELSPQSFEAWFCPTRLLSQSENAITIGVPNTFFKDWVEEHYFELIRRAVSGVAQKEIEIKFSIESSTTNKEGAAKTELRKSAYMIPRDPEREIYGLHLNPKFTFDTFVVGPSNRFAHAASLAVADSPAKAYNPLFIYGGVGMGKTHLMQAIGQYIAQKNSKVKVTYISSEKFTNELIDSIQNRTTLKFRKKYREVDVLLIDDIHFIAGKESTQEEFFHTFNTLYDAHNQIVMSSDRSPKDIPTLEERLVSRFEWGLVTDIQPPDLETRIAILRKKAEGVTVIIPDDVTFFIADKVKSNIRELEGALIRVVAYSALIGKEINVGLAQEILKEMLLEEEKKITIDLIQKKVAEYFDIRISDMKVKKRVRTIAYPRQVAMYLCRDLTDYSLPEIGEHFGGRDHTTVLHAYGKIKGESQKDEKVKNLLHKLISEIKK